MFEHKSFEMLSKKNYCYKSKINHRIKIVNKRFAALKYIYLVLLLTGLQPYSKNKIFYKQILQKSYKYYIFGKILQCQF